MKYLFEFELDVLAEEIGMDLQDIDFDDEVEDVKPEVTKEIKQEVPKEKLTGIKPKSEK